MNIFILSDYILSEQKKIRDIVVKAITCRDGFKVSIQASKYHYCSPRESDGPWTHFEMGYPSGNPGEEFKEYADSPDEFPNTVYGYVPSDLIMKLINEHGGSEQLNLQTSVD